MMGHSFDDSVNIVYQLTQIKIYYMTLHSSIDFQICYFCKVAVGLLRLLHIYSYVGNILWMKGEIKRVLYKSNILQNYTTVEDEIIILKMFYII